SIVGTATHADLVQQQAFLLAAVGAAWLLKLEVLDRVGAVVAAQAAEAELAEARAAAHQQRNLAAMHGAPGEIAAAATTGEVLEAVATHAPLVLGSAGAFVVLGPARDGLRMVSASGSCAGWWPDGERIDPAVLQHGWPEWDRSAQLLLPLQ